MQYFSGNVRLLEYNICGGLDIICASCYGVVKGNKVPHCIKNARGVTVKQRFASVNRSSRKQLNFGRGGCFFDVFYFFLSAGY